MAPWFDRVRYESVWGQFRHLLNQHLVDFIEVQEGAIELDQVNGLEIGAAAEGTHIKNLSIGGFSNGSGIAVFGARNVLLEDLFIGTDADGNPMPNAVGINLGDSIRGDGSAYTTVKDAVIGANTDYGISLGHSTNDVRVVGSLIRLFWRWK